MRATQTFRSRLRVALVATILAAAALSYCQQCARTADAFVGDPGQQSCIAVQGGS